MALAFHITSTLFSGATCQISYIAQQAKTITVTLSSYISRERDGLQAQNKMRKTGQKNGSCVGAVFRKAVVKFFKKLNLP
jgi:hypothetical protein